MSRCILLTICGIIFLAGCSTSDEIDYNERPATEIYNTALDALQAGDYETAATEFIEVERQHPYSVWARRAILLSAYAYYVDEEYDQSILAAQRYIMLYPGGESAPYAYYLVATCFYEQITDVTRDQRRTEEALAALEEVVRRFPDTEYARDAAFKIDLARDHLAGKEMEVGRYYLDQEAYSAAIGRFLEVLARYQTTTHTPEALHRLTEAYLALGLREEAQASAAILGHNYPASEWYEYSYILVGDPSY
ncbi:MAG: outer membrane protein assembly factor BamD [Hyphomicrobiales bacterium]|nr:outer membrane protein assembly factor BamD [Hyphomicrobiales bacterium]MCY4048831.1 outer membrane protein assembly factor BamD [Hyphomicrobiales bacterium]MCY4053036.1 outer membrane protein assembly factor BamD [Hyphomicrobiales bacterium]